MVKQNFFRRLFYNWHIKLISLVLAFILWKYVDSLNEKERYFNVGLIVKNIPEGYVVVNKIPKYIRIVIKGKDEYLSVIDSSDFKAYIDLKNISGLSSEIPVKIVKVNAPRNIIIKDVNPSSIKVKIEKLERKVVNVEPVVVGKPKNGYFVEDIVINPGSVTIEGPSSEIKSIMGIYTKEIDINNVSLTVSFNVPLIVKNFQKVKIVGNNHVDVIIKVAEKYSTLQIDEIKLKFLNLKEGFSPSPDEVFINAKVKIPVRLIGRISKNDILAFIDCKNLREVGRFILPIQVKALKKDIEIIGYSPEEIEFNIKKLMNK